MKKLITIIFIVFSSYSSIAGVINVGDTTLTNDWNAGGNILNITGKISGTAVISNAIIEANLFIQIFDTTITFGTNISCESFSARWYGAKPTVTDNSKQLQMSINACLNRGYPLFIPTGLYKYDSTLKVFFYDSVHSKYKQTQIQIYGTATFWDNGTGTQLAYKGQGSGIIFNLNKGTDVSKIILTGGYIAPGGTASYFYNLPDSLYKNQGSLGNGAGIVIDAAGTGSSGSTGCHFHDMVIQGFGNLIRISNGGTQNGENMVFERIQFGQTNTCVQTTQPQEKYNIFRDLYSWSPCNYVFNISRGYYIIDGVNIAGRCRNLVTLFSSGFFPTHFSNIYAESLGSIGKIWGGLAINFSRCNFDFAYKEDIGELTLLTSDYNNTRFTDCDFRYYGNHEDMKMSGQATFENCVFSGTVKGMTNPIFINYVNGVQTISGQRLVTLVTDTIKKPNSVHILLHKSNLKR